ncbi:MAG: hypothetical protein AB1744_05055 [Candidatus Zixiibacteriota bacterium]
MKRTIRKFKETVELRSSPVNRVRSHPYFPVAVFVGLFLVACCVHVWQRVKVLELVKDVSRLQTENADLVDCLKKLYADVSVLESPTRIERYAADTLGLQVINPDKLFSLERRTQDLKQVDEWSSLKEAVQRIVEHVPAVTLNTVQAHELRSVAIDSSVSAGESER